MKLVWVCISFEIIPFLTSNQRETAIDILKSTFNYDFTNNPSITVVIVWQTSGNAETFKPQIYYKSKIPRFESDKTYLLFTQRQCNQFCTYYWVGSTASLVAKKATAKYALLQYLLYKEYDIKIESSSISREEEFIESESFHNTINFVDRSNVSNDTNHYVDYYFPSKLPNLYIVRGKRTICTKAVPVSLKWFFINACLILEIGYKVHVLPPVSIYCGLNANNTAISKAKRHARFLNVFYNNYGQQTIKKRSPLFKAFVEVLENINNYRLHETDNSNDHLKDADTFVADCNRNVSFYKIYENVIKRKYSEPNKVYSALFFNREIYGEYGSYLFDSATISGLFVYIYEKADVGEKQRGLEMAEEYLHNNSSLASKPRRMRISEFSEVVCVLHMDVAIYLWDIISKRGWRNGGVPC